jgi:molybdopterin-guanine dinucleotide biosynthesis protein A
MLPIPCVIVAGGKSSRMGRDKALLPFGASPTLTQYQLTRLKDVFSSLHVSCKSKDKFDFEASFIEDEKSFEEHSPLVGLYSILKEFDSPVAILSVDTPFVSETEFQRLFNALDETTDIIIARSPFGSHQMCGIYKPHFAHLIKEQIEKNEHKIRTLFEALHVKYVDFENDEPFTNLNHPQEYENAKEKA